MNHFPLKYRTAGKGLPPQPIRLDIPGWAGTAAKMEDGSAPQPWHCNPFVEGSTYGLELIYPYETECQVINDKGAVRIEWDYARERDSGASGNETLSPMPPVECLSTFGDSPEGQRSVTPEANMCSVRAAVSATVMPRR